MTRKVTVLLKSFSLKVYTVLAFQVDSSNDYMLNNLKNDIHKQQLHYMQGWPDSSSMPNFAYLRWVTFLHSHSGSQVSGDHIFNICIWDCGSLRVVALHMFAFTVWKCHTKLLPKHKKWFLILKQDRIFGPIWFDSFSFWKYRFFFQSDLHVKRWKELLRWPSQKNPDKAYMKIHGFYV